MDYSHKKIEDKHCHAAAKAPVHNLYLPERACSGPGSTVAAPAAASAALCGSWGTGPPHKVARSAAYFLQNTNRIFILAFVNKLVHNKQPPK